MDYWLAIGNILWTTQAPETIKSEACQIAGLQKTSKFERKQIRGKNKSKYEFQLSANRQQED